jgi:hypothetical protein
MNDRRRRHELPRRRTTRRRSRQAAEMPRPPAEPARAARDGRRHAACRRSTSNPSCIVASGAPPVHSRVNAACSLTSNPLGAPIPRRLLIPPPAPHCFPQCVARKNACGRFRVAASVEARARERRDARENTSRANVYSRWDRDTALT